jgi:uncharacterized protein (DUF433 family)
MTLHDAVRCDPDILGGLLCFAGTRVPGDSLFDHLMHGYTVEYFLCQFPSVRRDQIDAVLAEAKAQLPRRMQAHSDRNRRTRQGGLGRVIPVAVANRG